MPDDDDTQQIDAVAALDSDSILVGAYVTRIGLDELRRYIAIDLVTAMQPLTKESLSTARQILSFLEGKGPRATDG